MMRWLATIVRKAFAGSMATAVALGVLSGCQPIFMSKEVYEQCHSNLLPAKLEQDFCPITGPITPPTGAPATVAQPDRPARPLTLPEAIAIALENGHASSRSGAGRGQVDDSLVQFQNAGSFNSQSERMRVLALNPALANAVMEASVSRFDAIWVNGMTWRGTDNVQTGIFSSTNGHGASGVSSVIKAFSDGSIAHASFLVDYNNLNSPPTGAFTVLNPQYTARLSLGFETPLWRDKGDINMLLARIPGFTAQSLNPAASLAANAFNQRQGNISQVVERPAEGILIARLRFDQSRAEFERLCQTLVLNTEVAYWNLYSKYGQLYSIEENLRVMHKAWQESYNRLKAGGLPPAEYYQVLGQFEEFRGERARALQEVLEAERQFRGIIGLPPEDGTRLIPITPPTLAELKPNWENSLSEAMDSRPELMLARDNLRYHQYLLEIQKNGLKPDLRFHARYEPLGIGSSLEGDDTYIDGTGTTRTSNAFRSLRQGHFADYQLGLTLNVPLGYRFEHAAQRAARLALTQSYYVLRDQEDKTTRILSNQYQELSHWYKRIEAHRAERMGYLESLKKRIEQINAGVKTPGDLTFLEAQRRYAAALIKEYNAIAEYNNTLARFEWSKGATLRYNNVHISEGPLPQCAQVRAVEYEKEKSRSLVLRDRPDSLYHPARLCATKESELPTMEPLPMIESTFTPRVAPSSGSDSKQSFEKVLISPKPVEKWTKPVSAPDARPSYTPQRLPDEIRMIPSQPAPKGGPALAPQTFLNDSPRTGAATIAAEMFPAMPFGAAPATVRGTMEETAPAAPASR